MKRREALRWMMRGVTFSAAALLGIPAFVSALSPVINRKNRPKENWHGIGLLADFPVGEVSPAVIESTSGLPSPPLAKGVYVWRPSEESTVVYSRSCTDLGCPIRWDSGSRWFLCPCHGGIFTTAGEPVAGPPRRPLYRYSTRLRDGVLEIDLHSIPAHA